MLVLSRRPDECISFPTLGISVQIVRVTGQTVRLGIQAPKSVPILRDELKELPKGTAATLASLEATAAKESDHKLRGRLHHATLSLYLVQKQLQAGLTADADALLEKALHQLDQLEQQFSSNSSEKKEKRTPHQQITALLVEDNLNESSLLESYLRLQDINVVNAADGRAALDFLTREPSLPDAVLLDMQMPRCDGPTTIHEIRNNPSWSSLRVYAVSGSAPEDYNVEIGAEGVNAWFRKPLNPAQIVQAISSPAAVATN